MLISCEDSVTDVSNLRAYFETRQLRTASAIAKSSPLMESPFQESQQKELSSLIRVRNRLASSPDSALAGIFTHLLPRLLSRFQSQEPKIVEEAAGIFSHIEERLQLNPTVIVKPPWVLALLENLSEDDRQHTEKTYASVLPTLEIALSQCEKDNLPHVFPQLCCILHRLHTWLSNTTAQDYSDPFRLVKARSLEATWARAGWLVFDHILIIAGITPVLDWQKDLGDKFSTKKNDVNLSDAVQLLSAEEQELFRPTLQGLFLDAMLFRPNGSNALLSRLARYRCEFRRRLTLSDFPRLNPFQHRGVGRIPTTTVETWIPAECQYWQVVQANLLQCSRTVLGESIEYNVLQVVVTGSLPTKPKESEHRLAASALVQQFKRPKRILIEGWSVSCPSDLAVALLFQLVGETSFKGTKSRSGNLGVHMTSNPDLQRDALPRQAWKRCFQFLQDCRIDFTNADETRLNLILSLVSKLSKHSTTFFDDDISMETYELIGQKISPSQCFEMKTLANMRHCSPPSLHQRIDHAKWQCACSILSSFRDDHMRRHQRALAAERRERTDDALLHRNRERLARNNPFVDYAIQARHNAYAAVASSSSGESLLHEVGELSWDLALMTLNCAVFDKEAVVSTQLQRACGSILQCYTQSTEQNTNRTQPLFLSVQRACLSSTRWVRQLAFDWTDKVIVKHDERFAQIVFTCMLHDDDEVISSGSVKALSLLSAMPSECHMPDVQFVNLCSHPNKIKEDLDSRIKTLQRKETGLDRDSAFFVLKAHQFSCETALFSLQSTRRDSESSVLNHGLGVAPGGHNDENQTLCGVCFDEISVDAVTRLSCRHSFCHECWKGSVDVAMVDKSIDSLVDLKCLQHDCDERVSSLALRSFAPAQANQWQRATISSFVDGCRRYCPCPNPDCAGVAILPESGSITNASCSYCNVSFCPSCGEGPHSPVSCTVLRSYQLEANRFDAAVDEIDNRIQDCPNCGQRIQKNGGCNHMTCTACGHEFCWLCLSSDWASHTCRSNLNWELPQGEEKFRAVRPHVMRQEQSEANEIRRLAALNSTEGHFRGLGLSETEFDIVREVSNEVLRARKFLRLACTALYGLSGEKTLETFDEMRSDLQVFVEFLTQQLDLVVRVSDDQGMISPLRAFYFCKTAISVYEKRLEVFLEAAQIEPPPMHDTESLPMHILK